MTRTERLLRLARLRGDRLAIATLEGNAGWRVGSGPSPSVKPALGLPAFTRWSEAELRAAWGDR